MPKGSRFAMGPRWMGLSILGRDIFLEYGRGRSGWWFLGRLPGNPTMFRIRLGCVWLDVYSRRT